MRISVQVKPRSRKPSIVQLDETNFVVAVSASPVDGAANKAVAYALAEHFDLPPTSIILVSGPTNRRKVFDVPI